MTSLPRPSRWPALLTALQRGYAQQLRLQQRYAARHDLSGLETLAACRQLRWREGRLCGDLLP